MPTMDPDTADVARFLAGDLSGFEAIVGRWQSRLVSLAWRFCRDRAAAEDMAQEVFVKAFRSLASFRGDGPRAVAKTRGTAVRHGGVNGRCSRRWRSATWRTPNPRDLEDRERDEHVRRAVLTLPERYRDAILVFYFEEKDLGESARILGIPEGTLKARLHRARDLLKRRCANDDSLEPSSGFLKNVMAAAQELPEIPHPNFPWRRFLTGLEALMVMAAAGTQLLVRWGERDSRGCAAGLFGRDCAGVRLRGGGHIAGSRCGRDPLAAGTVLTYAAAGARSSGLPPLRSASSTAFISAASL
jgi:RNA polymerase sigma-70 factor, ECF subfamily